MKTAPIVETLTDAVALNGGVDLVSASLAAKPGTVRGSINYEQMIEGGYQSAGTYERFDGRARPSDATFVVMRPSGAFAIATLLTTLQGATSAAAGTVIASTADYIVVTAVTGTFVAGEVVAVGASPIGTVLDFGFPVSQGLNNRFAALAANVYRSSITAVPGSGPVRGVAALGSTFYAWRDNAGATACVLFKATASGWAAVPLFYELSFTAGSVEPAEGATISKSSVSATVMRVVLESGEWGAGTAAGRYIITAPSGGSFTSGALTTAGAGTIPAAGAGVYIGTQITLLPGGKVEVDRYNFRASLDYESLYGCDGVNREFELRADVLVPITTGMGTVRAKFVKCHQNHMLLAFKASVQASSIGEPYQWSAVTGAAELGAGDDVTGFAAVSGSQTEAALMVMCANSAHVLYGESSATFNLKKQSDGRGARPYSVQSFGNPICHDVDGMVAFSPTLAYGNFTWERAGHLVAPYVRERTPSASVFVKSVGRYRCFFSDGAVISGANSGKAWSWMPLYYPMTINVAFNGEVGGRSRTFYGASDGYVYEADVGRSADGATVQTVMKLSAMAQRSPFIEKTYRGAYLEASSPGLFELAVGAVFDEDTPQIETTAQNIDASLSGANGLYDLTRWDDSYYDTGEINRRRIDLIGGGRSISPIITSMSDSQLPHKITYITMLYTKRRVAR